MSKFLVIGFTIIIFGAVVPLGAASTPTPTSTPFIGLRISSVYTKRPGGYYAYQTIDMIRARDGFDGYLELWIDQKIPADSDENKMAFFVGYAFKDFKPARLCLFTKSEKLVNDITLIFPVATFQGRINLYGDGRPVFQVDQLNHTETYASTDTEMVGVEKKRLVELPMNLSQEINFHFGTSSGWKLVPSKTGKGKDIVTIETSSEKSGKQGMNAVYSRYFFNGYKWEKKQNTIKYKGSWDPEDERLSNESQFPN